MLMESVIETMQLTKQYQGKAGCKNITIQVPRGVVFGYLGPNGAGKSTFVRTLLGLLQPTSGIATILGEPIGSVQARKKIGYLPELFRYPDWLTGRQLLESHLELSGYRPKDRKQHINQLIERVGLQEKGDQKIKGYSKGMQQRIGLAAALIGDPELIFLDEPTSALDPIGRKDVRELMAELRDQGKTIFLNSHLLSEVESVCDHVAIINRGELIVQGEWRTLAHSKPQIEMVTANCSYETLQELPELVEQVEWLDGPKETNPAAIHETSRWLVTLCQKEHTPHLVAALCARGAEIHQVTPKLPHLEEIFMQCVTGKGES
ncbi:ABC transporter ATP-binding protein [Brevibacillus ginsengisoli]|uniref:ABC transporter ATP-binding protein n=1 Tax=Brevibacillus ginsengisoli TaxID=363854 RepID=UPI003CF3CBAD